MALPSLNIKPIPPSTLLEQLMHQTSQAANSDGTLTLVRSAAEETVESAAAEEVVVEEGVVVAAEQSVLRGIFAWVGAALTGPAAVAAFAGGVISGDTPIRERGAHTSLPAFDAPPHILTVPQWLAEIQEVTTRMRQMAEMHTLINLYEMCGLTFLADQVRQDLELLKIQMSTTAMAYPIMGNQMQIKASASDASDAGGGSAQLDSVKPTEVMPPNPLSGLNLKMWQLRPLAPAAMDRLRIQRATQPVPVLVKLSEVMACLLHSDALVVAAAAIRLAEMRETLHTKLQEYMTTVVESLVTVAMQDPVTSANRAALIAAAMISPEQVYPLIEKMIKNPEAYPDLHYSAREALTYMPTLPEPAYHLLAQLMKDPNSLFRRYAFETVARDTPDARALIVSIADSALELNKKDQDDLGYDEDAAGEANVVLGRFSEMPGIESVDGVPLDPQWQEALRHVDRALASTRGDALSGVQWMAGWMGRSGQELLRQHIENPSRQSRMEAFQMLDPNCAGINGLPSVIRLTRSRDRQVATEARDIMAGLTERNVEELVECLKMSDIEVRSSAAMALRRLGYPAIEPLDKLIRSGEYQGDQLMLMTDIRNGIAINDVVTQERKLKSKNPQLSPEVEASLKRLSGYSIPMLEALVRGRNELAAKEAARLLSNMGLPGRNALLRLSQTHSAKVQERVTEVLGSAEHDLISTMLRPRLPRLGEARAGQSFTGDVKIDAILEGALRGAK